MCEIISIFGAILWLVTGFIAFFSIAAHRDTKEEMRAYKKINRYLFEIVNRHLKYKLKSSYNDEGIVTEIEKKYK